MRISIGQIIILALIFFLLFGDLKTMKKHLSTFIKGASKYFIKKNRKKGI